MNVDANPGAVTRHMQENLCPCQKLKITVISGFRTKIAVVAKYRAKITVHCRGFWLPYKNYCGDQLPCNNYRSLPWWLATVQGIPWLPITVHQLLCNTVVAAYRGKRYRDEKSLPRNALLTCTACCCSASNLAFHASTNHCIVYTIIASMYAFVASRGGREHELECLTRCS